jgi:hypothetical protein
MYSHGRLVAPQLGRQFRLVLRRKWAGSPAPPVAAVPASLGAAPNGLARSRNEARCTSVPVSLPASPAPLDPRPRRPRLAKCAALRPALGHLPGVSPNSRTTAWWRFRPSRPTFQQTVWLSFAQGRGPEPVGFYPSALVAQLVADCAYFTGAGGSSSMRSTATRSSLPTAPSGPQGPLHLGGQPVSRAHQLRPVTVCVRWTGQRVSGPSTYAVELCAGAQPLASSVATARRRLVRWPGNTNLLGNSDSPADQHAHGVGAAVWVWLCPAAARGLPALYAVEWSAGERLLR